MHLAIEGFSWPDLHHPDGLRALHDRFDAWLAEQDAEAHARLAKWRAAPDALGAKDVSATIVAVAPYVGRFVARLFGVEREVDERSRSIALEEPVFAFRKAVLKKRVVDAKSAPAWSGALEVAHGIASAARTTFASDDEDEERAIAIAGLRVHAIDDTARKVARGGGASWTDALREDASRLRAAVATVDDVSALDDGALAARVIDAIVASIHARRADAGDPVSRWPSLRARHELHHEKLVRLRVPEDARAPGELEGPRDHRRERVEPFALTDHRGSPRAIATEVDLCLDCHAREKDSCSKGLKDKSGALKKNPIGVELPGCPLHEPIGEMNELRRGGEVIGALAAVTIANPMCPGTGHRICNDCMKACVFQTSEPVNIPEIETRVLEDVLRLPWGFEIWSLLTRWNPLHVTRPYPRANIGKSVLVVGLGPAGYTLCHHLVNEGFGVVAIDGLKLEPLPAELVGSSERPPVPVRDVDALRTPLEERVIGGFGGVSEYGITVRWDKSFLALLHLNLARRATFRAYGGVRFGGTITLEDAWSLGFDHVAIAAGAGKPTMIDVPNGLARGVRQASDFLMGLQLGGAFKRDSLAQLQVRLPAVVIGGGLTAIDAATELLAYYVVQVEKTLERVEAMARGRSIDAVLARLDDEEREVVREHLEHARALREERAAAARELRAPRIQALLDSWGGVRLAYRRRLADSPAYRLNHEEVAKSLEEGVRYLELLAPAEVHVDRFGAAEAISFERQEIADGGALRGTGEHVKVPARTILVAAGTRPNVTYEREHPGTFAIDRRGFFASHDARVGEDGTITLVPAPSGEGFFTSYAKDGRVVSYYGDNHPKYAGSVVKAMASAKDGHVHVSRLFARDIAALDAARGDTRQQSARDAAWSALVATLDDELLARVHETKRLAPGIVEVVVHAPRAARAFRPGQFYRLQGLESLASRAQGTTLVTEGLALTGARTDLERGLVSVIVLEMGASSKLCERMRPGDPIVLMGPTGAPTEIGHGENVLLLGGGLGNAVLFSIGRALREAGSRVLYFAGYRDSAQLFEQGEIEASSDQVIWANDHGAPIAPRRPQDAQFRGNIVQAMQAYERGELGERVFSLGEVDRVLAIGSDGMMRAVRDVRQGLLAKQLGRAKVALGSINSPMQCMMKEICGQCLQRRVDPATGAERFVYTCYEQDQPLDEVDFDFLRQRLRQSSAHEKLADAWLAHVLASESVSPGPNEAQAAE
ncbi:Glutamate synthase [NADPH] small chain [Sandaracinus amylolyticus]|uniref:Glutamate synthase [NADPH] small chain n=1 Tax=Sandaracinus amylolyticus TaxID=927083 RepID=A0A0F6W050_9BACT|nr:Glutamate synthase [NADPH] small chain [Sandaracinus amylolyticus]